MIARTYRGLTLAGILIGTIAVGSCRLGNDLALQIGTLTIGPNPATEGDAVTFAFGLTVVPENTVTITAFINDEPYFSQELVVFWDALYEFEVGSADAMIERFGLGVHTARVQVFVASEGETLISQSIPFELE